MNEKEQELAVTKLVTGLASIYQNAHIPETTIRGYVAYLKDIPLDILQVAINQAGVECKFFPSVAEIRELAIKLQLPDLENGMTAWGDVKKAMSRYGFYRSPKFDNPITAATVDRLGWQSLCSSENEEADRAHFARIYDNLVARQLQDARLLPSARALKESSEVKQLGR